VQSGVVRRSALDVALVDLAIVAPFSFQLGSVNNRGVDNFGDDIVNVDSVNARLQSTISTNIVNEFRFQYIRDDEPSVAYSTGPETVLRDGGTMGILSDLNTQPHEGVFVPFFGKLACTTAGVATLALKTDAVVIPTCAVWDKKRKSYFFQDTWKTTRDLTLTLGIRYEDFGQPANEAFRFPAFAGFDPANFLVPNKVNTDKNNFGPIIGFAYSPNVSDGPFGWIFGEGKSVIRGGYQVSYDTWFNNLLSNIAADSPNNTATTTTGAAAGRGTWTRGASTGRTATWSRPSRRRERSENKGKNQLSHGKRAAGACCLPLRAWDIFARAWLSTFHLIIAPAGSLMCSIACSTRVS